MTLKERIQSFLQGEVSNDPEVLSAYSTDASLFRQMPKLVCSPRSVMDIQQLVALAGKTKGISLTCRAGGSDMTGGPLGSSIVVDVASHMHKLKSLEGEAAVVEPGMRYRDFEKETLKKGLLLPSYPASRELCCVGGMVANNAGGEKGLRYGKTEKYIESLRVVLDDAEEYEFRALTPSELKSKMRQKGREGEVYRKMFRLLEANGELIAKAKPDVSKNSAGYALWNIWDGKRFDLTQLFCGSQGTLGIITEITFRLVRPKKHTRLGILFLRNFEILPDLVNQLLPLKPVSMETFDEKTLKLALRFFPEIARRVEGKNLLSLLLQFIPEFFIGVRMLGFPKLVVLVEFEEDTRSQVRAKTEKLRKLARSSKIHCRILKSEKDAEKYWVIRHESFNLLREHVAGKRTAPFIDDFIVQPRYLPQVIPKVFEILKRYKIEATLAGHAGSGNFHIIPLMDLSRAEERAKIKKVSDEVYDLIVQYKGSITAEHNDGLIRTPYLEKMYGPRVVRLFKEVKKIFDPKGIFNPGKKVGGSIAKSMRLVWHE